jgi:hypothetical protein
LARIEPLAAQAAGGRRWTLHLPPAEFALLASLPDQLAKLLANPDQNRRVIDRLFPASYADAAQEQEHRALLGASLLENRKELVQGVRALFAAGQRGQRELRLVLGEGSSDLLLRFLNDMRLVLATDLGIDRNIGQITVSPGDPDAPRYAMLVYLGGLESLLVEALIGDPGF